MRYPGAIWAPGPVEKQGYTGLTVNAVKGAVLHSMVGRYADAKARLDGPDRASWQFSVLKDGTVYQHYETTAVCWHAGNMYANGIYVGIEHEGGPKANVSEPLTPVQLAASVRLVRWLSNAHRFPLDRTRLHEHNAFYATACPSGRIPWAEYTVEEDMRPYLCWDKDRQRVYLIGPFGAAWITQPADVATLEGQFGKLAVAYSATTIDAIG